MKQTALNSFNTHIQNNIRCQIKVMNKISFSIHSVSQAHTELKI